MTVTDPVVEPLALARTEAEPVKLPLSDGRADGEPVPEPERLTVTVEVGVRAPLPLGPTVPDTVTVLLNDAAAENERLGLAVVDSDAVTVPETEPRPLAVRDSVCVELAVPVPLMLRLAVTVTLTVPGAERDAVAVAVAVAEDVAEDVAVGLGGMHDGWLPGKAPVAAAHVSVTALPVQPLQHEYVTCPLTMPLAQM